MKNIIISESGVFLGLTSALLVIKKEDFKKEIALNRIKTIQINAKGVTVSSNLLFACAVRGIKIFFNNSNGFYALNTVYQHKSVKVREYQYGFCNSDNSIELAKKFITGKIKNQKSTLLYFLRGKKYDKTLIDSFNESVKELKSAKTKEEILGIEGMCAMNYFEILKKYSLLPESFILRTKRNSKEITNIALNYGYAILQNFIYKSVINAGLEPYLGVLHSKRSGKPSLVLDIMEEYRSFVVDRNIIKLRSKLSKTKKFETIKKTISKNILDTIHNRYTYNKKKITLESIIQRQIYKLSGYFAGEKNYKSYVFRW